MMSSSIILRCKRYQLPKNFLLLKNVQISSVGFLFTVQPCICTLRRDLSSKANKPGDEIKIDLKEISKKVADEFEHAREGKETELDRTFMNFNLYRNKKNFDGPFALTFSWKYVGIVFTLLGSFLVILYVIWQKKAEEREKSRKMMIGRARIGGEWELTNMEGKPEGSRDLLGKWLLIYFGFTNCPDVCPVEIEKLVDVIDILDRENSQVNILPLFISVDPERDTIERVRRYCAEFSPKLRGYTGSKEQVHKVTKAFRIYHSEGPRTKALKPADPDDYIVDHTIISYLIDPEGQFLDYYGQNRRARDIAQAIKLKAMQWDLQHDRVPSWVGRFISTFSSDKKSTESQASIATSAKEETASKNDAVAVA